MNKSYLLFFLFLLTLFAPYLLVFTQFSHVSVNFELLGDVYLHSSMQALASTALTLILALPGAMGLFWLRSKTSATFAAGFEFVILLPSLLPRLFVLVSFLNLIPFFPFGVTGVVVLHALSEVGLVSLILHRLLQYKLAPYIESAEIMGVGRKRFLRTVLPLLAPQLLQIVFVLFLFFISSVSIPLILAGGEFSSLEAVIYQKILGAHDWNQALNLFIVQTTLIVAILTGLGFVRNSKTENTVVWPSDYLGLSTGLLCIILPVAVILVSLLIKIPIGLIAISNQSHVMDGWQQYLAGSLLIGFVAGGISFLGLSAICYFYQESRLRRWFVLVMTPSSVMLAFAFFLLPGESPQAMYFKISGALALGFLPALKRFGLLQRLETLGEQAEVVTLMGASSWKVFSKGIWPQALPQISMLSGLGAVWAMGDFAVSRIVSGRDMTLAMWTQSLVDQYRWDMALVLSWLVLGASFVVFGFFWSLSYVSHKKLSEGL